MYKFKKRLYNFKYIFSLYSKNIGIYIIFFKRYFFRLKDKIIACAQKVGFKKLKVQLCKWCQAFIQIFIFLLNSSIKAVVNF